MRIPTVWLFLGLCLLPTSFGSESIPVIRKTVSEVQLTVVATDRSGRPLPSLSPTDLVVQEDGQPVETFHLRSATDLPLRVGILLDLSDSTRMTWAATRPAVTEFLQHLLRPNDEILVLTFDSNVELARTATTPEQLEFVLGSSHSGGQTALFDALYIACQQVVFSDADRPRRSALVVFSDGEDNLSRHSLGEAIEESQRAGIAVYTISTHNPRLMYPGDAILRNLASATGGRDFVVSATQELREALTTISGELRSSYLLYYRPPTQPRAREFRHVRVLPVQNDGSSVHSRSGYFVAPEPEDDH